MVPNVELDAADPATLACASGCGYNEAVGTARSLQSGAWLLLVGSCFFDPTASSPATDGAPRVPDAGADASADATPACADSVVPFGPTNFSCLDIPLPGAAIVVDSGSTGVIDTDEGTLELDGPITSLASAVVLQQGGPDLLLVAVDRLEVESGGTLLFSGSRPIAIVSAGDVVIDGTVDIGASGSTGGPGSGGPGCSAGAGAPGEPQTAPNTGNAAGTGGGGGGFGSAGGAGARVQAAGDDVSGGIVSGSATLEPLRGGCPGGAGGTDAGGFGGGAGGALQLVAAGEIRVGPGGVLASPGGGGGGSTDEFGGGGGGGSGGALLLEAPVIAVEGAVTANGGGGGEGTRGGDSGNPGDDGRRADAVPASGGAGGAAVGGDGGDGAAGSIPAERGREGVNDSRSCGSGGGGGGGGRIRFNVDPQPAVSGVVSPTLADS